MNTPNNAAAEIDRLIAECAGYEQHRRMTNFWRPAFAAIRHDLTNLRATLAQPDATRPRAIWPDALSSPERHQLRVLLECVDRRVLSPHEADQLVNLIADALTSQPSGEAVAARLTVYADTKAITARIHDVAHSLAPGTYDLYTHPSADAPRVAVDEAMVERAMEAHADEMDRQNRAESLPLMDRLKECMRAAITAALAPKPEGGHG